MLDSISILLIIIVILAILLFHMMDRVNTLESTMNIENFDVVAQNSEAIANVAKLYKTGDFTVTNMKVTGKLEVDGEVDVTGDSKFVNADIGNWKIRNDRIGIPDRGDLHLAADNWVRLYDYGTNKKYAGAAGSKGGFAGMNLWCAGGTAWSKRNIVDGVTLDKHPAYGGIFRITAPLEVDQAMNTGVNWNRPGIMAKNIVIPSKDFTWGKPWWTGPGHQTAVNVANKMPTGSLVIGPSIGHDNKQTSDYNTLVSAAKKVGKNNCKIRGMYLGLNNHGGALACR